jgi:hypothetical protein
MALFLVVRHRKNPKQPFENVWQDDELLTSIQTTVKIGELCKKEQNAKRQVYVHRCGYEDFPPVICCSVQIADVAEVGGWIIVEFREQKRLDGVPPVPPIRHQNHYVAPSP